MPFPPTCFSISLNRNRMFFTSLFVRMYCIYACTLYHPLLAFKCRFFPLRPNVSHSVQRSSVDTLVININFAPFLLHLKILPPLSRSSSLENFLECALIYISTRRDTMTVFCVLCLHNRIYEALPGFGVSNLTASHFCCSH